MTITDEKTDYLHQKSEETHSNERVLPSNANSYIEEVKATINLMKKEVSK